MYDTINRKSVHVEMYMCISNQDIYTKATINIHEHAYIGTYIHETHNKHAHTQMHTHTHLFFQLHQ